MSGQEHEGLVRRIHDSPIRIVLAVTGGGAAAMDELLGVAGASRTVLEAVVPYSGAALVDFLGGAPNQFCSAETARAMAVAAFTRALALDESDASSLAGVACTASLATDREKRGPHRAHLAAQTVDATTTHSLEFEKGRRSRRQEELLLGKCILNLIAESAGVEERLDLELSPAERVESHVDKAQPKWGELLLGRLSAVRHGPNPAASSAGGRAVFPGAFHPRHAGHRRMAELAQRRLGAPVEHEICVRNVDKPPLDFTAMRRRLEQFGEEETLWLTNLPLFVQKAEHFGPATLLVGADTIARIADSRYYAGDDACQRAIEQIAKSHCRFLVFGRQVDEEFVTLCDLELPEPLRKICDEVTAEEFREDVSGTKLRN